MPGRVPAAGHGGGGREQGGRSVPSGFHGCAVCEGEVGRLAAGCEKGAGGTGVEGAASWPEGGSGGGDGKAGGSGSCGRTEHDEGAWRPTRQSPPGLCAAGWQGGGCG